MAEAERIDIVSDETSLKQRQRRHVMERRELWILRLQTQHQTCYVNIRLSEEERRASPIGGRFRFLAETKTEKS